VSIAHEKEFLSHIPQYRCLGEPFVRNICRSPAKAILPEKIRLCEATRKHARNHELFIAIAQEVVRWSYKALHSRERKRETWISSRGASAS